MIVCKVDWYERGYEYRYNREQTISNIGYHLTSTNKEYVPVFMLINQLNLRDTAENTIDLVELKEQYDYRFRERYRVGFSRIDRGLGKMYLDENTLTGCCTQIRLLERITPYFMLVIHRKYIPYFYSQILLNKPINNSVFEWWFYSDNNINRYFINDMFRVTKILIKKNNIPTKYVSSFKDCIDMPEAPKKKTMKEYRELMTEIVLNWGKKVNHQNFTQVGLEVDTLPF